MRYIAPEFCPHCHQPMPGDNGKIQMTLEEFSTTPPGDNSIRTFEIWGDEKMQAWLEDSNTPLPGKVPVEFVDENGVPI